MSKVQCTISFTDGEQLKVEWDSPEDADVRIGGIIDAITSKESFALEIEGRLIIVPIHSVRTIQIDPAPAGLPQTVVRGAWIV